MNGNCIIPLPAKPIASPNQAMATPTRRIGLKTLRDVRREMARVYRDVRCGNIESSEGTRLTFMLAQIGKVIGEIESARQGDGKTYEDYLKEMHEKIDEIRRAEIAGMPLSAKKD